MTNPRFFAPLAAAAAVLFACKTGSHDTAIGAATMTAAGVGAAAVSRASGGCIAICTAGTVCNPNTGLCERRPSCDARCEPGNRCVQTYRGSECVPEAGLSVSARADGGVPAIPVAPVLTSPDSNTGAPTIVPTAEKNPPKTP